MVMTKAADCDVDAVKGLLAKHVPETKLESMLFHFCIRSAHLLLNAVLIYNVCMKRSLRDLSLTLIFFLSDRFSRQCRRRAVIHTA